MTPIDYIRIDADILQLKISDKSKFLAGLIKSFNNKGLKMSNSELAELICCSGDHIGRLLKEIRHFIKIENPQSRHRKIFYSGENVGVESKPTPASAQPTPAKMPDITKVTKRTEYISQFDKARKIYPGTKRGLKTEFDNFKKKHRDWTEALLLLEPAIEQQSKTIWANCEKKYIPHFQTWLNQRRWEFECSPDTVTTLPFDRESAKQREKMLAGIA